MPEAKPTNMYYEWWLRDWIRSTVDRKSINDKERISQEVIDQWGATRRRQLTWAELLERYIE
jgi:hypothetical protein